MSRIGRVCVIAFAGALGLALVTCVAYAVETVLSSDEVVRNTELAGHAAGGMSRPQLARLVADVADEYRSEPVVVDAPGGGFTVDARELGLSIDTAATEQAAMRAGRNGNVLGRITGWVASVSSPRKIPVQVKVDEHAVRTVVAAKDPGPRTPAVEPVLKPKSNNSGFLVIDGKAGKGIDPVAVVHALPTAASSGGPIRVKVDRGEVKPQFTKQDVEALHDDAVKATAKALPVTAGGVTVNLSPSTLRSWVHTTVADDRLQLTVDSARAGKDLPRLLARAAKPATQTTFTVQNGMPVAKAGAAGSACCADGAPGIVANALFGSGDDGSRTTPVALPMKDVPPTVSAAVVDDLGVDQLVSSFTTNYPAGQPRVTNIHRIADIVKGTLIPPGATFSLNGAVGQRTLAKGFVVDHEINDQGEFDEAVGGGVSQFATTTFNAAFFAGLDYGEYQSHSIYISRYPYGREATVSWQHPDLQIRNTAQTSGPIGPGCTRVTTERTRSYLDGRTAVDKVYATYQPKEGVTCR
jgi:vancomycin resistance protein YoaR